MTLAPKLKQDMAEKNPNPNVQRQGGVSPIKSHCL